MHDVADRLAPGPNIYTVLQYNIYRRGIDDCCGVVLMQRLCTAWGACKPTGAYGGPGSRGGDGGLRVFQWVHVNTELEAKHRL